MIFLTLFSLFLRQTNWIGGEGQWDFSDTTKFWKAEKISLSSPIGAISPMISGFFKRHSFSSYGVVYIGEMQIINQDTIFVGAGSSDSGRLFMSIDGGETFYKVLSVKKGSGETSFSKITTFIKVDNTLIAGGNSFYIYRAILPSFSGEYKQAGDQFRHIFTNSFTYTSGRIFRGTAPIDIYTYGSVIYSDNLFETWDSIPMVNLLGLSPRGRIYFILKRNITDTIYVAGGKLNVSPGNGVAISINNGITWTKLASNIASNYFTSFIRDADNVFYASFDNSKKIYRSFDNCFSFPESLATLVDTMYASCLLYAGKNSIYACAQRNIYASFNNGNTWDFLGSLPYNSYASSFLELPDYRIWVGVSHATSPSTAGIYQGFYADSSYLISSIFDSQKNSFPKGGTIWKRIFYEDSLPAGSYISVKLRTGSDSAMSDTCPWDQCPALQNGDSLNNVSSVLNGHRYIQYRVDFFLTDSTVKPIFKEISIEYEIDTGGPYPVSVSLGDGQNQENGYDDDDFTKIVFSEKIDTNLIITQFNIDSLFILNNNHKFSPYDSVIWSASRETLCIFTGPLRPDLPQAGDTLCLSSRVKDLFGNSGYGCKIITGTYNDIAPPLIIQSLISDGNTAGNGLETDDSLYFEFNEKMDTSVILAPDSVDFVFTFYNGKSWMPPGVNTVQWINDSTLIFLFNTGIPDFIPGDSGFVQTKLKDKNGNIINSKFYLTGTYDRENPKCDSVILYNWPPLAYPISSDDQVILYFNERTNSPNIDSANIDIVLRLSGGKTWVSGSGQIGTALWIDEGKVFLYEPNLTGGAPTVFCSDTIYPDASTIKDLFGNPLLEPSMIQCKNMVEIGERENLARDEEVSVPFFIKRDSKIELYLLSKKEVKIEVFDVAGRKIEILANGELDKGKHTFTFKKAFKNTGVYFIYIKYGNTKILKKVLRIKPF